MSEILCPVCKSPKMSLAIYWPGQPRLGMLYLTDEDYWFCYGECWKWYPESECIKLGKGGDVMLCAVCKTELVPITIAVTEDGRKVELYACPQCKRVYANI